MFFNEENLTEDQKYSFQQAKEIALGITKGHYRRAKRKDGWASNYTGLKMSDGVHCFVIADSEEDLPGGTSIKYEGKPAVLFLKKA